MIEQKFGREKFLQIAIDISAKGKNKVRGTSTKDKPLEIKCYDRNQKDKKIAWRQGVGFLCIH